MSEIPEALRLADALDGDYYYNVSVTAAAAELRRQHAEITRLRVAVLGQSADLATLRGRNYETQSLLKGAEAECDALRADAERYRYLRECARATSEHWGGRWSLVTEGPAPESNALPAGIDAAIDAARALKEAK